MRDAPYSYIKAGTWGLLLILPYALLSFLPAAAQSDQPRLLSDLDIPLMEGFQEEEDSRVVFDTPEGRIIEVRAHGPEGARAVYDYYRLVLSSLSWRITDQNPDQNSNQNSDRNSDRNFKKNAAGKGPANRPARRTKAACAGQAALCIIARRDRERLTIKISRIVEKKPSQNKGQAKDAAGLTVIDFLLDPL